MSEPELRKWKQDEDTPRVIMARIVGEDAEPVTQASIGAITYIVYQFDTLADAEGPVLSAGTAIVTETSAGNVSDLIYDTLQADNDWDGGGDGYNFKLTLPASCFPTGGKYNRVEVWCEPTSGDDFLGFKGVATVVKTMRD